VLSQIVQQENNSRVGVICVHGEYHIITIADIAAGEVILNIEGRSVDVPSRYSVQIAKNEHIEPPEATTTEERQDRYCWVYLNHCCEPTTYLKGRQVIALRNICAWEQITFDYCTTEYDMAEPFNCQCGAKSCRGWVKGFRYLSLEEQERLRPNLPDYLSEILEKIPVEMGNRDTNR
jgi:hypothetical protein